jgi:hypothetical protein
MNANRIRTIIFSASLAILALDATTGISGDWIALRKAEKSPDGQTSQDNSQDMGMGRNADVSLRLARDGKTEYAILVGKPATESETFAAAELKNYLEKATGATFAITEEGNDPGNSHGIYVGWTQFAAARGTVPSKLSGQEWVMQTVGQDLVLTGGRPVGSLYAVYEFLEKNVGCHWLDRNTEIVPRRSDLTVLPLKVQAKPAFLLRTVYTGIVEYAAAMSKEVLANEALFQERNKSTDPSARFGHIPIGSPGPSHTFHDYSLGFPEGHPEYFSMNAKGERERSVDSSGPGQICLTNPQVRKLMLARLKAFIANDREVAASSERSWPLIYEISSNDNGSFCQCPTCKAFMEKEGLSGVLIDFVNEIANGAKDQYPDMLIRTFAPSIRNLPETVRPRDSVVIRLAQMNGEWKPGAKLEEAGADYFHPMTHPINRPHYEDLARWSKIAKHLAVWDYWIVYGPTGAFPTPYFPTPYANVHCLQPDLKLFLSNHVTDVFVECEDMEEKLSFSALKLWLGQKLLQDPDQPVEPLLAVFFQGYYGSAAAKMREYLRYMERCIDQCPTTMNLSAATPEMGRPYLNLKFFETVNRLLDEAERSCKADPVALGHVQRERIPVDIAVCKMWSSLHEQLGKGQAMPFDRDAIIRRCAEVWQTALNECYGRQIPESIRRDLEGTLENLP